MASVSKPVCDRIYIDFSTGHNVETEAHEPLVRERIAKRFYTHFLHNYSPALTLANPLLSE